MGMFGKTSIRDRMNKLAVSYLAAGGVKAQGGGGGVETRWRGASRLLRSMVSWVPGVGSPRRDLQRYERHMLVARSRDAMRNHLIGRAAVNRVRTSVVGTGLLCRPSVNAQALGLSEDQADTLNAQLEREFRLWSEDPRECDAEASSNFHQLQSLALVSALTGGDVFVTTPSIEREGAIFSTRLQLIETDRVSNPDGMPDTDNLIEGVAFDNNGAPTHVYVCSGYPYEQKIRTMLTWQKIPVFGAVTGRRRVLQIWCDRDRPGQKRGAPYLAPVLEPLQKLERYSSAELMAAVVSAMFTVFIKKTPEADPASLVQNPLVSMGGHDEADIPVPIPDEPGTVELGEGAVVDLAPGEEPAVVNPARPNAQFDPFFMAIAKEIGAALEQPVEEILMHYSSSYSAARAAMLQAWRYYEMRRWWLVCDFCQPAYELFIDEAVARGRIHLPGYADPAQRRAYTRAIWIGPARGAIDELKEARAAQARIDAGVSTETMETMAMSGESWEEVIQQRGREMERRRQLGLIPPTPKQAPVLQEQE
ncbi:phage portal protein, lambda family [Frateuria aurantia DSM 6220]|uniref:Phage portal protein, lambda family n=2 Tax=Frateuria aurantia TaxID=81475 RepID=H8L2J1_FRAAD|nr:phage portal protein, lambda family [Frateuria aurantia DSM 6220]